MTLVAARAGFGVLLCSVAAPALATLPAPGPLDPNVPFAFETASYSDGSTHYLPFDPNNPVPQPDPAYITYQSRTGANTAYAGYPTQGGFHPLAQSTVNFGPVTSIYTMAINPGVVNGYMGGRASAHGEIHYQYQVLIADPNSQYNPFDTYSDVVVVSGSSHIATDGPRTSVRIAASANTDLANAGLNFTTSYGDGSGGGAYSHDGTFSFGGAAQFIGDQQIGGIVYATFIGSITMQADVYGVAYQGLDQNGHPVTLNDYLGLGGEAYIDPSIIVSHAFLQAHGAAGGMVNLSPGIANSPPVVSGTPEPESWALLITGFGFIGAALRRRTKAAA